MSAHTEGKNVLYSNTVAQGELWGIAAQYLYVNTDIILSTLVGRQVVQVSFIIVEALAIWTQGVELG